jgi:hypothetical protein
MHVNYRVYVKATPASPWRFTGVIESSKDVADKVWSDIVKKLRYHSYKLEWCTYGA